MRLVSLNIDCGSLEKRLMKSIKREAKGTDIFVFQEVTELSKSPFLLVKKVFGGKHIYSKLKSLLPDFVAYRSSVYVYFLHSFLGIFIRKNLKVVDKRTFILSKPIKTFGHAVQSKLLCIKLLKNGQSVWICNTHGILVEGKWRDDTPERIAQSKNLINALSKLKGEKIVCGDLNLESNTKSIRLIETRLKNLTREFGIKNTRSSLFKLRKEAIDYVFVSSGLKVKDFRIIRDLVSDHRALCLDFTIL